MESKKSILDVFNQISNEKQAAKPDLFFRLWKYLNSITPSTSEVISYIITYLLILFLLMYLVEFFSIYYLLEMQHVFYIACYKTRCVTGG